MKGYIYMMYDINKPKTIYVGSTKQNNLDMRKNQHKYSYSSYLKGSQSYYSAFDLFINCQNIDIDIKIELIKEIDYDDICFLKQCENDQICKLMCENNYNILNINKAYDKSGYIINKAYRNFYKKKKSTKMYIDCPDCNCRIKISVSPILQNHYFNDCIDYNTDSNTE